MTASIIQAWALFPIKMGGKQGSWGLLESSSWVCATEEEFTLTRFSTSVHMEREGGRDNEGEGKEGKV